MGCRCGSACQACDDGFPTATILHKEENRHYPMPAPTTLLPASLPAPKRTLDAGYPGAMPASTSGRAGPLNGSFFSGGGDPTGYLGGQFGITGTDYQASGTFASAKQ